MRSPVPTQHVTISYNAKRDAHETIRPAPDPGDSPATRHCLFCRQTRRSRDAAGFPTLPRADTDTGRPRRHSWTRTATDRRGPHTVPWPAKLHAPREPAAAARHSDRASASVAARSPCTRAVAAAGVCRARSVSAGVQAKPMHLNGPPLSAPDHAYAHRRGRTPCTISRASRPTRKHGDKAQVQQEHPQARRHPPATAVA